MPTLDDYRRELVMRLEGCADAAHERALLAEAELLLTVNRIGEEGQDAFWQAVNRDLDLLARDASVLRMQQARYPA